MTETAPPTMRPSLKANPDLLAIDTIRTLAIDAVEKAQSGHAGAPMALAPVAYTLWSRFLRYDPDQPHWPNRDRFVLSNGHASMLLYALLHLAGVKRFDRHGKPLNEPAVSLEDIENFRELGGVCAGHPEYGLCTGVETTTGPLGQGVSNSVGMAIAGRWLASRYNTTDAKLFDYNVYAICSDGDLMEGVASEAASVAGHLRLSNLCWIYDDNSVTIEGHTEIAFTEDVAERFRGYGWATRYVDDANDCEAFAREIENFQVTDDRPTLIIVRSVIGYGSPHKAGTPKAHSDPLGPDEVKLTKEAYGWPADAQFLVPDGVSDRLSKEMRDRGGKARVAWDQLFQTYAGDAADKSKELKAIFNGEPASSDWEGAVPSFPADPKGMATREASGKVLNAVAKVWPWLIGGSADLGSSNKTLLEFEDAGSFEPGTYSGRNLHFGVREHAMGSIANGLSVSGLRAYTGTFFTFSDYMKPPIRLAALMETPTVFVFSHDSIGIGQDGPTHQPIEQLVALRAVPGLLVVRPADANETAEAWKAILKQTEKPACLVTSRQGTPTLDRTRYSSAEGLARGGYILAGGEDRPEVILIGCGAEMDYVVKGYEKLVGEGVKARLVSMPCWSWFEEQNKAYRDSVLPPDVSARVVVEAGSPVGWDRYAGASGEIIAMRSFGSSAPASDLFKHFGFTVDHIVEAAKNQIKGVDASPSKTSGSDDQSTKGGAHQ